MRYDRKRRLERYLLNSPRFLWGVYHCGEVKGQRAVYEELMKHGCTRAYRSGLA